MREALSAEKGLSIFDIVSEGLILFFCNLLIPPEIFFLLEMAGILIDGLGRCRCALIFYFVLRRCLIALVLY